MGIAEHVQGVGQQVKDSAKSTSILLTRLLFRTLTGFFLGLTFGLIGQEIIGYGTLGLILMLVVTTAIFFKISSSWSIAQILIFDLICILVGQILKMYILLAP